VNLPLASSFSSSSLTSGAAAAPAVIDFYCKVGTNYGAREAADARLFALRSPAGYYVNHLCASFERRASNPDRARIVLCPSAEICARRPNKGAGSRGTGSRAALELMGRSAAAGGGERAASGAVGWK